MHEKLIGELKKLHNKEFWTIDDDGLSVTHPEYKGELSFDSPYEEDDVINKVAIFLQVKYEVGKSFYYDGYFEILVNQTGYDTYFLESGPEILPKEDQDITKLYYEVGPVSDMFSSLLEHDLSSHIYTQEHYKSFKVHNVKMDLQEKDIKIRAEKFLGDCYYLVNCAFFDISRKTGLNIAILDLSNVEAFDYELDEADLEQVKTTELTPEKYDADLLRYYNRASEMTDSEFKYIAYFQVLECIFDEVYLYETVQDAKSIIDSSWFRTNEFDHVTKLVAVIDRFNKEQNDRNKIKLVLDRFFKLRMHDDAYLIANEEIINNLLEIKLLKSKDEFKDVQKVANAIYDIRNEYTHSNRAFPKRKENNVDKSDLKIQIKIIRAIAETIIINYKKWS